MRFKQILAASLITLSSFLPASGQPLEGDSAQFLLEAIKGKSYHVKYKTGFEQDESLTGDRGGPGSSKPLGVVTNKGRIVFNSDYKKVDPKIQAEFASALHTYIKFKNGSWEGYQKYHASDVYTGDPSLGGPFIQHPDAFEKSHVPYDTLETFARDWWQQHSETYRAVFGPFKQGFLYDAILDGMQIYDYWELYTGSADTDHLQWISIVISDAADKK